MDFLSESLYWIVPLTVTLLLILLARIKAPAFTRRTVYCLAPIGLGAMVVWAGYKNYTRPSIDVRPVASGEFTPQPIEGFEDTQRNFKLLLTCSEPLIDPDAVRRHLADWYDRQDRQWFHDEPERAHQRGDERVLRPKGYQAHKMYQVEPAGESVKGRYKEAGVYFGFAPTTPQDIPKAAEALSTYLVTQLNRSRFNFNLGVDLAGGSILVYQVDEQWWQQQDESFRGEFDRARLASIIKRRLDPSNLLEITVRPVFTDPPRVEIILPIRPDRGGQSSAEIAAVKNKIRQIGELKFRLVADARDGTKTPQDIPKINEARNRIEEEPGWQPKGPEDVPPAPEGYKWYEIDHREARRAGFAPSKERKWTTEWPGRTRTNESVVGKVLILHQDNRHFMLLREPRPEEPTNVTGSDLSSARPDYDTTQGQWVVSFHMTGVGSAKLAQLTEAVHHFLAIVLDDRVVSFPILQSQLSDAGQITVGTGDDAKREVDTLVTILQAGSLPAKLSERPVSELSMGPTLGRDTIEKGTQAVFWAFIAVVVFMIIYYRFAGFVASTALFANLLLTIAFMVTFKAAFTLPGLAGLVLMLGMAVDANVLIYERIREERARGGSLALSIRNGYDRAFPTIIDTHLTSIFTAIVLYAVGNDNLKGFGISLTVGLVISLFTALYMTRYVFDLFTTQFPRLITELRMFKLLSKTRIDFMRVRHYWFAATVAFSLFGLALLLYRGSSALNIDFTGGTAYAFQFEEPKPIADVRAALTDPNLSAEVRLTEPSVDETVEMLPSGERRQSYLVRTTEKDRDKVRRAVAGIFAGDLKMVKPEVSELTTEEDRAAFTITFKNQRFAPDDVLKTVGRWFTQAGLEQALREADIKISNLADEGADKDEGLFGKMTVSYKREFLNGRDQELLNFVTHEFDVPVSNRLENFDSQLAAETQLRALYAISLSWLAICMYLWFRFGNWTFGLAAVLCLVHDLLFTIGLICLSHYVVNAMPGVAYVLGLEDFKIDLAAVAALLTLVGLSVNDTIVVFDRIREVRGKNPELTPKMINESINQTLSRTILTGFVIFLTVFVLYVWGGEGIHLFSFVMLVGVIVGTYSSIYVASPLLLMFGEGRPQARVSRPAAQEAGV